jgi:hypothetical protein
MRALSAVVLIVIGVLCIVVGILYLTQPAHALPTFIPGYLAHANGHHNKRGIVALIVGAVIVIVGLVVAMTGRRYRW